jgi:aspartate/methionine/tyrosine aminotransferase
MKLPPFLLDEWLDRKAGAQPPIDYDLGSSAGPAWRLSQLLELAPFEPFDVLADALLTYQPSAGSIELRTEIATFSGANPDDVVVVAGASEALWILFFVAAEPRGNVVVPRPGFPPYEALGEAFGLEVRTYTLTPSSGFALDVAEASRLIDDRTRLVILNSPHNPTGAVVSDCDMARLHDLCLEQGVPFVSDEVFHPVYHGSTGPSATRLPAAIVVSDLSKALSLSGLRIGWIVDRDRARREQYLNARRYFTISNTALGERLATLALQHREAIYARTARVAGTNLGQLDTFLAARKDRLGWVRPRGGMTAFPWLPGGGDSRVLCERLLRLGVMLVPGDCFGAPAHFRLGFGSAEEGFAAALERLAEALDS